MASLQLVGVILLAVASRAQQTSNVTGVEYPGNGTDKVSTVGNDTATPVLYVPAETTAGVNNTNPESNTTTVQPPPTVTTAAGKGIGEECTEDIECNRTAVNSACRNSICECLTNYVYHEGLCWEKQILGGDCNHTLQCQDILYSQCFQGICACEPSRIPSPVNTCLEPATEYLASCEEDIQCTHSFGDEARCSNSQCKCTSNYHHNGTSCVADKKLGDGCLSDEECVTSELGYVEGTRVCTNNICDCATGHSALPGEEICTKSSAEELTVSLTWVLCVIVAKYYLA